MFLESPLLNKMLIKRNGNEFDLGLVVEGPQEEALIVQPVKMINCIASNHIRDPGTSMRTFDFNKNRNNAHCIWSCSKMNQADSLQKQKKSPKKGPEWKFANNYLERNLQGNDRKKTICLNDPECQFAEPPSRGPTCRAQDQACCLRAQRTRIFNIPNSQAQFTM